MARILVVDDLADMRTVAALALRRAGHEVETARNGREALESLENPGVDLVLLDLSMPEVSGFDVLKALSAKHGRPPIPVVIFSAVDDAATRLKAARLGAVGFVTKRTADIDALRQEVDQHLPYAHESSAK